jgi:NAD-dependent DNA ligase
MLCGYRTAKAAYAHKLHTAVIVAEWHTKQFGHHILARHTSFTGTAQNAGGVVSRDEMMRIAEAAGLTPVKSVTKTRCEVLVTAEIGSQSGKARKAQEMGKPVFSVDEFLAWVDNARADRRGLSSTPRRR